MLQPKRTKFRKQQKGKNRGLAQVGNRVSFGDFGLKTLERGKISARQIEAARRAMTRHVKRGGKVWIRIFPDTPVTAKPVEVRARAVRQQARSAGGVARRQWGLGVVASLTLLAGQPVVSAQSRTASPSGTPSVHALVAAALRCQGRGTSARADVLYRRARLSGLVPRLRLSARRGQEQDLSSTSGLAATA